MIETSKVFYCGREMFERTKDLTMQNILSLKQVCLTFAERNSKELREQKISGEFPNRFLMDLVLYAVNEKSNLQ